ncbi:MAG: glycosyltransferase family 4 protein [Cyanobacteria bacterium SZAS LIN-3]|nr:glycosyltransferase family 4 protein [Cyanobacteria bacterium SZAS LIN-3]
MRICLISREYPPETGFGGIATFTRHLAMGLKALGHDVEVVCLAKETARTLDDDGVPVHRVLPFAFKSKLATVDCFMPYSKYLITASTALWHKFAQLHDQKPFDVVDTPELLAEGIMPAITRVAPLVIRLYTPHSKFIAEKLHNVSASFDHQNVAMIERIAMLQADVLTSPSKDLAEFVAGDLNVPLESIEIVQNPLDTSVFCPEGDKALPPTDKLRVVFVGRLEERKGITYLVEAIPRVTSQFKNVEFVIIGDDTATAHGGTSVLAQLKDSLKRSGSEGYVTFIDRIALADLPKYYRSADISIVPSVYDNSPYTALEAMSCGRPVIGTSGGGTKEYVAHGESGLIIEPRDSEAIASALLSLLTNEGERLRLSQGARKRAVECFDRKAIAAQTVALYEQAARHFIGTHKRSLYRHDFRRATEDACTYLDSLDKAIYDLLYQRSIRFRFSHWWHFFKARPRLFAGKTLLKIAKAPYKIVGTREERMPAYLKKLELAIASKEVAQRDGELAGRTD